MYELGSYVSNGSKAAFFRIRDNSKNKDFSKLGVKINFKIEGNAAKKKLKAEMNTARILKDLGISVLDYKEVIMIKIPDHIDKIFKKDSINFSFHEGYFDYMKDFFLKMKGQIVWGLVMDYIEDDSVILQNKNIKTLVSSQRIKHIYDAELKKMKSAGVYVRDSDSSLNVLWSESRAKLYFIDFDSWGFKKDDF